MPEISKSDYVFFQKAVATKAKQRRYDTEVRLRMELYVKKAKEGKIVEPTNDEVNAEIERRIKNGTLKPF